MKDKCRGVSLIETLVVIAIIGMMMAMLFPALQGAREATRRMQCADNLYQLSRATDVYYGAKRCLPGFINSVGGRANRLASWPIVLFPYMEENNLWSIWNDPAASSGNANAFAAVSTLACPDDDLQDRSAASLSYVANCGTALLTPRGPMPGGGGQRTGDGVFFIRCEPKSRWGSPLVEWDVRWSRIHDGCDQTLMFTENIQASEYSSAAYFSPPASASEVGRLISDAQLLTGFVWDWDPAIATSPPTDERRINGKKDFGPRAPTTSYYYSRPSSFHPGGVNAAMCSGAVIWLRDDIEYKVYEQLMTSDGVHSNMQGPKTDSNAPINYELRPQDYQ